MSKRLHRPRVPHKIAYLALAALYASACFGMNQIVVYAIAATIYSVLSTD